ncbi:carbon storage regulator, CsrA [Propionispira arboris]|uniref:Translational regulator CsrA n=1 Tax=Propionispira arboris TaxID=84035 RepID=A0A1H7CEM5_9FIRM|nr:carbon storage regulator CsrA [Propionispira arboris]SEJ88151.1 carbon storage regulator, CsrA [Propionispira arboris]
MLALTRKPGQQIMIGDNIIIHVVDVQGDNVRLGIEAPKAIKIYRSELYQAIVEENKKAVASSHENVDLANVLKNK